MEKGDRFSGETIMVRCSKTAGVLTRRQFSCGLLATTAVVGAGNVMAAENNPAFTAVEKEFHFDTGVLRGTLHGQGKSKGLVPAYDSQTGTVLAKSLGLFSHYRLLDDHTRYGVAGWEWVSEARPGSNGSVEVNWSADEKHPFDMKAVYRWAAPDSLDLTTTITARSELKRFEVFLASYFEGFPVTKVYAKNPAAGGNPSFMGAGKDDAVWNMFPRDEEAVKMIRDGRWKYEPHPVDWAIRPVLAAPLAIRRDAERGIDAVAMARLQDCFAVATPRDEEGHRSIYLSLFGRDFTPGESAEARSRLVIRRNVSDGMAVELYEKFLEDQKRT